jgi:hypothetical protein
VFVGFDELAQKQSQIHTDADQPVFGWVGIVVFNTSPCL